jgi:ATP-dependent RNA helicase SUPV3L1/SUV3
MPALLKPAPTRLRLVLWSLSKGLQEFPESPPPGLVTVPAAKDAPEGYHDMAGYRAAGERAIRIDMLERLADMLRVKDSQGGFEADPDMLSITGMTLDQFAALMDGLGYNAVRGERERVRADAAGAKPTEDPKEGADVPASKDAEAADPAPDATPAEVSGDTSPDASAETPVEAAADATQETPADPAPAAADAPEAEVFYTFTWGGNRNRQGAAKGKPRGKPRQKAGPKGKGPKGKGGPKEQGARVFSSRPEKKERIDPDNPFAAALMGLKQEK